MDDCPAFFGHDGIVLHNPHAISARWDYHGVFLTVFVAFDMDMQEGPLATQTNFVITADGNPLTTATASVDSARALTLTVFFPNLDPLIVSVKSLALLGELLSVPGLQADLFDLPATLLPTLICWFYEDNILALDVNYETHLDTNLNPLPGDFSIIVDGVPKVPELFTWDDAHRYLIEFTEAGLDTSKIFLSFPTITDQLETPWGASAGTFNLRAVPG